MSISFDLRELTIQINAVVRVISARHGLTLSQSNILLSIPTDGISLINLSKKIGVDISTMSRNIQKLSNQNVIIKERSAFDLREYNLFVTELGEEMLAEINKEFDHFVSPITSNINFDHSVFDFIENINWSLLKLRNKS